MLTRALHCLIYRSRATGPFGEADCAALLRQARRYNQTVQLGGLLLYYQGHFMQVLEGPEPALSTLYARVQEDPRHRSLRTLSYGAISARCFPDWPMGFATADRPSLSLLMQHLARPAPPDQPSPLPSVLSQLLSEMVRGRVYTGA